MDSTEVRKWAKAQGIDVKNRGRVPAGLVVKFKTATANYASAVPGRRGLGSSRT